MIIIPKCLKCAKCGEGMKCDLYPKGIPSEILQGGKKPEETCKCYTAKYKD